MPGHFVVVERLRRGRLSLFDPTTGGELESTPDELYRRGGGWVLTVEP
jgi:hypothetical protein